MNTQSRSSLICVPITEPDADSFVATIHEAEHVADAIELRLDYLPAESLPQLIVELNSHVARQRVELSQLVRLLDFTQKIQDRLVYAMKQARADVLLTEKEIDKLSRSLERKRNAEEIKETEKRMRAAKRHLTQLEWQHNQSSVEIK